MASAASASGPSEAWSEASASTGTSRQAMGPGGGSSGNGVSKPAGAWLPSPRRRRIPAGSGLSSSGVKPSTAEKPIPVKAALRSSVTTSSSC
jgi:hypothetical protein